MALVKTLRRREFTFLCTHCHLSITTVLFARLSYFRVKELFLQVAILHDTLTACKLHRRKLSLIQLSRST